MTSGDANTATEKHNNETTSQESICSCYNHVVLYAVQRSDNNSPIN